MPRYGKLIGSVALIALIAMAFVWSRAGIASPKENPSSFSKDDSSHDEGSSTPSVIWAPNQVTETLQPGGSKTISLGLTAPRHMATSSVCATSDISGYLNIAPVTIGPLKKGQTVQITLSLHVPIDATPTTTPGYIYLRPLDDERNVRTQTNLPCGTHTEKQPWDDGQLVIAKRLPVSISVVWPTIRSNSGVMISYPGTLRPFDQLNSVTDTITLTNFGGNYEQGGLIPPGGMDIVYANLPALTGSLNDFLTGKLATAQIELQETITIDGFNAVRVRYAEQFSSSFSMKYVDVYVSTPTALHKFSLAYNPGDPHEATYMATLQQILDSAMFP